MNIGVIGIGRWGKNLVREFEKIARVTVAASFGNRENIAWLAQHYPHIRNTTNVNDVFEDRALDAVIIATLPNTHADLVLRALQARKHVFVEKPLSVDPQKCDAIETLARQNNRIVFVGHILHYHPVFEKITSLIHPADIQHINVTWTRWGTFSGDIIWDLFPHDAGLAYALFGKPSTIEIMDRAALVSRCDMLDIKFIFPDKKYYHISINRAASSKRRSMTIFTNTSALVWEDDTKLYQYDAKQKKLILIFESDEQSLTNECRAFIAAIENNTPVPTDVLFGKSVVEILDTIRTLSAS